MFLIHTCTLLEDLVEFGKNLYRYVSVSFIETNPQLIRFRPEDDFGKSLLYAGIP